MSDILHRVDIDAKPEQVFKALTTIEGLRGWWFSTATGSSIGRKTRHSLCLNTRIGKSRSNSCITAARSGRRSCSACGTCWRRRMGAQFRMTSKLPSMANAGENTSGSKVPDGVRDRGAGAGQAGAAVPLYQSLALCCRWGFPRQADPFRWPGA
jgi:hypothetical protein